MALRETTICVSSVFTHMDMEGDNIVFARVGLVKSPSNRVRTRRPSTHLWRFSTCKVILALALLGDGQCEELQAKHIEVSAGLLHASTGTRFLLER